MDPLAEYRETDVLVFSKLPDGSFEQSGELPACTKHGLFQWQLPIGTWDGGWTIEPIAELTARMELSGPYKYAAYRILYAEKPELVIKPTCYGCGMIAGIGCSTICSYSSDAHDSLVDFNEDRQFSVSLPVATKGKHFGKSKSKTVWFNSVSCADLYLIGLARKESRDRVSYDYSKTLAAHRAAQGWKRCLSCRKLRNGIQFCDEFCQTKYESDVAVVLDTHKAIKSIKAIALCKAGSKCLWAKRSQPAPVTGMGDYCSNLCMKSALSARVRLKKALKPANSVLAALKVSEVHANWPVSGVLA